MLPTQGHAIKKNPTKNKNARYAFGSIQVGAENDMPIFLLFSNGSKIKLMYHNLINKIIKVHLQCAHINKI